MSPFVSVTSPEHMPESFWVSLIDRGLSLAMACFVAWLFAQWFQKAQTAKDAVQTSKDELYVKIIDQLTARVDGAEKRLEHSEARIRDCEEDRSDLRRQIEKLQKG